MNNIKELLTNVYSKNSKYEIKSSADVWATLLFIARKRKMRPLGNWYLGLDDEIANLFDACGPKRQNGTIQN